jgi:hypothetical protein
VVNDLKLRKKNTLLELLLWVGLVVLSNWIDLQMSKKLPISLRMLIMKLRFFLLVVEIPIIL